METITLYFKQGASDKVYQASLEAKDGGFIVTCAYGRRGSTLSTGSKTPVPVDYDNAKGIYDKVIKEKIAKGYMASADSPRQVAADKRSTGIHCQLLSPADESQLDRLLSDPGFWAQEKLDGRRLLLEKKEGVVTGINKLGFTVSIPEAIAQAAKALKADFLIDGEAIGEVLHVFDLLSVNGNDEASSNYATRSLHLLNLFASTDQKHLRLVPTAFMPLQKRILFERLKTQGKEGIVFKRLDAPYISGRPSSGGTQFKYKFCESASCIVGKINAKRSVRLEMLDGERLVSVGSVTIPVNHAIPVVGSVIECRYLYAFKGGSLFQPVYLGPQDDVPMRECLITQLKFKAEPLAA